MSPKLHSQTTLSTQVKSKSKMVLKNCLSMVKVFRFGKMEQSMMGNGTMAELKEKASSFMLMGIYTRVNSLMTRLMDRVHIIIRMDQDT